MGVKHLENALEKGSCSIYNIHTKPKLVCGHYLKPLQGKPLYHL
jgi:hypothetical protein